MAQSQSTPDGVNVVPTGVGGFLTRAAELAADVAISRNETRVQSAPLSATPNGGTPGTVPPASVKTDGGQPVPMSNTTKIILAVAGVGAVLALLVLIRRKG